ncbi:MAG: hypothetical protein SGPRY_009685 [Prymnesium sp.]
MLALALVAPPSSSGAADHLRFLSRLPQVPCRDDIAPFAQRHFALTSNAAEIGVFRGNFSSHNLRHWKGRYFAVDAWAFRPEDARNRGGHTNNDKNFRSPVQNAQNYEAARSAMAFAGDRVQLVRNFSVNAAATFEDGFFDWLYIDALHSEPAVVKDLNAWWPKLRPGGLMSGDDYGGTEHDSPMLSVKRWERYFGPALHCCRWGVIKAVHDFAAKHGLVVHVTFMHDCYRYAAWYIVKPLCWPDCH